MMRRAQRERLVELADRVGIFAADVDVALARADRLAGDRHAFDQRDRDRLPSPCGRRKCRCRPRRRCRRCTSASPGVLATVFHLIPAGKPAPPRPRRPEASTSSTIALGADLARAAAGPAQPPVAS